MHIFKKINALILYLIILINTLYFTHNLALWINFQPNEPKIFLAKKKKWHKKYTCVHMLYAYHVYNYTCIHTYIFTYMHVCVHTLEVYSRIHMYVCMYVYVWNLIHTRHKYIYTHMHAYLYIFVFCILYLLYIFLIYLIYLTFLSVPNIIYYVPSLFNNCIYK